MSLLMTALPALLGALSHVLYFNRGEHVLRVELYAVMILSLFVIAGSALAFAGDDERALAREVVRVSAWYFGGLYSSLLVYRLWLHPLNAFPGPFGAKISTLWFSSQLSRQDGHVKILELHRKYGDFVRIGSSDLSIIHPEGVNALYGPTTKCTKAEWYDLNLPMVSLQTTREKAFHARQRRLWSNAFSEKALRGYEERTQVYRAKLMDHISKCASDGSLVDVSKWLNLYSFDVMGDLAFGNSFRMLDTSELHWSVRILEKGLDVFSLHLPPWTSRLLRAIPWLARDWWKWVRYTCDRLDDRLKSNPGVPDLLSTLLEPWKNKPMSKAGRKLLEGESQLIIVAGSDSTSVALANILYELVKSPRHIRKLREELDPLVENGAVDFRKVQNLPHLNGVINEALRLHPAVPTALERLTPPEGITVGGRYIAGNMTVWCPQYAIGRTETLYRDANAFVPERWYSRPDMVTKEAFAPFSIGAYSCIGKSLALQNMRNTLSEIVVKFDIRPGNNNDIDLFEKKTKDHFTLWVPQLRLSFSRRDM